MLHNVFAVYDSKSEAYLQPFFMPTKGSALRAISDCVNDAQHQFAQHPEDYTLFHLGTFEDNSGVWGLNSTPASLAVCIELLNDTGISR